MPRPGEPDRACTIGPDKLPKVIQDTMAFIRKVREFSDSAKEDIRRELGPEFKDFEFGDLNPKTFIRKNLMSDEDEYGLKELRELVRKNWPAESYSNTDAPRKKAKKP